MDPHPAHACTLVSSCDGSLFASGTLAELIHAMSTRAAESPRVSRSAAAPQRLFDLTHPQLQTLLGALDVEGVVDALSARLGVALPSEDALNERHSFARAAAGGSLVRDDLRTLAALLLHSDGAFYRLVLELHAAVADLAPSNPTNRPAWPQSQLHSMVSQDAGEAVSAILASAPLGIIPTLFAQVHVLQLIHGRILAQVPPTVSDPPVTLGSWLHAFELAFAYGLVSVSAPPRCDWYMPLSSTLLHDLFHATLQGDDGTLPCFFTLWEAACAHHANHIHRMTHPGSLAGVANADPVCGRPQPSAGLSFRADKGGLRVFVQPAPGAEATLLTTVRPPCLSGSGVRVGTASVVLERGGLEAQAYRMTMIGRALGKLQLMVDLPGNPESFLEYMFLMRLAHLTESDIYFNWGGLLHPTDRIHSSNEMQAITSSVKICNFVLSEHASLPARAQELAPLASYTRTCFQSFEALRATCFAAWSAYCAQETPQSNVMADVCEDSAAFKSWCSSGNCIDMRDWDLQMANFSVTGRGITPMTLDGGIPAGSTVLSSAMLINIHTVLGEPSDAPIYVLLRQLADLDDDTRLLLFVLHEKFVAGPSSRWAPYFASLPAEFNTSVMFDVGELCELEGTYLLDATMEAKEQLRAVYYELFPGLSRSHPGVFPPEVFTYERFLWARALFDSRAMRLPMKGADGRVALVVNLIPFVDMINHWPVAHISMRYYDEQAKRLELHALGDCPSGQELFLHYGTLQSWELVLYYGFLSGDTNPFDMVPLFLSPEGFENDDDDDNDDEVEGDDDNGDGEEDAETEDDTYSMGPVYDWMMAHGLPCLHHLRAGAPSSLLVPCARACLMTRPEFERVQALTKALLAGNQTPTLGMRRAAAVCAIEGGLDQRNALAAAQKLSDMLAEMLGVFATTAEEDMDALAAPDSDAQLSHNQRLAIRYRLGVKRIIQANLERVSASQPE